MIGIVWAIAAGLGFGLFQSVNRRAGRSMDVYRTTFILLLVSAVLLGAASLVTEDLALLRAAPPGALLSFAAAGFIHFFAGWTLLSISQQRVGAARTGALIGAVPLFGTVIAALTLDEFLSWPTILGVVLVVAGVYVVSSG
ncbi:MAG: EamA family transporter [Anaerolineae bacterium]